MSHRDISFDFSSTVLHIVNFPKILEKAMLGHNHVANGLRKF